MGAPAPGLHARLVLQHVQRAHQVPAGMARGDDVVDVAGFRRGAGRIAAIAGRAPQHRGALRAHEPDLRVGPGIDQVGAEGARSHGRARGAEGLAQHHRDQGDAGLRIGEQQLSHVPGHAAVLLRNAGQEAGRVHEVEHRDAKGIAEADEAGRLARGIAVEHACQHRRLVGHDPDSAAIDAGKAGDDVAGKAGLQLEEVAFIAHLGDELLHVIGGRLQVWHEGVQGRRLALRVVEGGPRRCARAVVQGQECEQATHLKNGQHVVVAGPVGDRRDLRVHVGTAELLGAHVLARDGFHHVGRADEQVAVLVGHEDEVGQRCQQRVRTGAAAQDQRDLGHDTGGRGTVAHDRAPAGQRGHAALETQAGGVEEADDRQPAVQRQRLQAADLLRVQLGQRALADRHVLGEDAHRAPVDGASHRDHAIAVTAAVSPCRARTELGRRAGVEQELDPLAGGEPAARMPCVGPGRMDGRRHRLAARGEPLQVR